MAHDDKQYMLDIIESGNEEQRSALKQLADAKNEIVDLKMQIAWLERSYD
jgi:hypothetical protein